MAAPRSSSRKRTIAVNPAETNQSEAEVTDSDAKLYSIPELDGDELYNDITPTGSYEYDIVDTWATDPNSFRYSLLLMIFRFSTQVHSGTQLRQMHS